MTQSRLQHWPYSSEVLMIEMMAQTAALLLGAELDFKKNVLFAKIEYANFLKSGEENMEIEIFATSDQIRIEGAWFDARVTQHGQTIAESRIMLTVAEHLPEVGTKSVTFHKDFMDHFDVRNHVIGSGEPL